MAQIIGLKEKQLALKEINHKLKALEPINEFLKAENPTGLYTISFDNVKSSMLCSDVELIQSFVFAYKKKLVDELNDLANKHSIEFDEEEKALF